MSNSLWLTELRKEIEMAKTSGGVRGSNPYMSYSQGSKIYNDAISANRGKFEAQARNASTDQIEKFAKAYNAKSVKTSFRAALMSNPEVNATFKDYTRDNIESAALNKLRREVLNAELKRRRR